jgi:hypothetical protein
MKRREITRSSASSPTACALLLPTHKGINWLLWRCVFIQGQLLEQNLLVRGGVALGGHYQSDNVMFSQGLLRSYLLESTVAQWPRVIVSDEVVRQASDYGQMDGQPDGGQYPPPRELLKQDQDGCWFVDYFRFSDHPEVGPARLFAAHKPVIEQGAKEYSKRPDVLKYFWMAEFHNQSLGAYGQPSDGALTLAALFPHRRLRSVLYGPAQMLRKFRERRALNAHVAWVTMQTPQWRPLRRVD